MSTQSTAPTNPGTKPPGKPRRRRWIVCVLVVVGVILGAYWLACHSFVTRRVMLSRIQDALGVPVEVSSVDLFPLSRTARLRASGVRVRAEGVSGDAGEVLTAESVEVSFPLSSLWSGGVDVRRVVVRRPVIRISQSLDDGSVNIASFARGAQASASRPEVRTLPELLVSDGEVQLGEHSKDGGYTLLKSFLVSGEVEQTAERDGSANIAFRQKGEAGGPEGIVVRGRVSKDDLTLTLTGVDFSTVKPENVPRPARDIFSQVALEGLVPQADVTYSFAGGWNARFVLQDVALNLPVPVQPDEDDDGNALPLPEGQADRHLRIGRTSGELLLSNTGASGRMTGFIEDLPYDVRFSVEGVTRDAPWTCTLVTRGFRLEQRPQVLRFAPGLVRRRLRDFSDPTGILDAEITVSSKGVPTRDGAQPISVRGSLFLKDVTAAFHRFPYRFKNLQGEVNFNDERVLLTGISGVSDSGARIIAEGKIEPLDEEAGFNLDVFVRDLKLDDAVQRAMEQRGQKDVLPTLMDTDAYARFLQQGLLRRSSAAANALVPNPGAPVFDLGGTVDVHVAVWRERGLVQEWEDAVTIVLPDVALMPKAFPYPLRARGVTIYQRDNVASVSGGELVGPRGGSASIVARVDYEAAKDAPEFVPDVQIDARGFPIDDLLLAALPTPRGSERPLGEVIAPLRPSGTADARLRVRLGEDNAARYVVDASMSNATLAPLSADGQSRIGVRHASGTLHVGDDTLDMALQGLMSRTGDAEGSEATDAVSPVTCRVIAGNARDDFAPDAPGGATRVSVSASEVDLAWALEDFARCFAPEVAGTMEDLRARHDPQGVVSGQLAVDLLADGGTTARVTATPSSTLSANVGVLEPRTPVQIARPTGSVVLIADEGEGVTLQLERLGGEVSGPDGPCGSVVASGELVLRTAPAQDDFDLRIGAVGVQPEREAARRILNETGGESVLETLDRMKLTVKADADVAVARQGMNAAQVRGRVTPRALTIELDDGPMTLPSLSGSLVIDDSKGTIDALRAITPEWDLMVEGTWDRTQAATTLDTVLSLSASRLSPDLRALLPKAMRDTMSDLNVEVEGPIVSVGTPLRLVYSPDGEVRSAWTKGSVAIDTTALDMGVRVSDTTALLNFEVEAGAERTNANVTMSGELPSFRASGVELRQGRFSLRTLPDGTVFIPEFSGRSHGGRISGALKVGQTFTPSDFVGPPVPGRPFELAIEASNVRFASLLEDIKARNEQREPIDRDQPAAADGSRGALSGSVTLSGISSLPSLLRGRGNIVVRGGRVVSLPALVPLIRVTNLELPGDEPLDNAMADFYLQSGVVNFEQVNISSKSVGLYGFGTATWPGMELDMRFRAGNRSRIPILTPFLEGLRGELATAVVRGSADNPDVNTVAFDRTRRVIEDLFGRTKSPEQRRLDRIESRVTSSERRERREDLPPIEPTEVVEPR
ncbi:MAG TPA: hypothetical protein VHN77_06385 [Phycisphaerales bacterium]|nr:hypothetical protein [Phycisphaerales bacterium]